VIIDFHCHAGRGDAMSAPWNSTADLTAYLRRARRAGITRTVVLPTFHRDYAVANTGLARVVARHYPRLIGFAMVNCGRDAGRIRALVGHAVERLGFRGVKAHASESGATRELCEAAREFALPVLIDVFGKPQAMDLIAPEYRDVDFILPHMGSFSDDWKAQQQVVDLLVRHPNVYADTSGVRRFDYLVQAVRRAGPRKLIFGSDGPWLHPGLELHKIRLLGLSPEREALILGGNAAHLLAKTKSHEPQIVPRRERRRRGEGALTP
jgi:predicted TIM-barrel fold metal-dependent hydrolase